MKRVLLALFMAGIAFAGVYEQKLALKQRADAIGVQLDELGIRDAVMQRGPRRVAMPQELLQEILLLVDDYRALNSGRFNTRFLISGTETEPNNTFGSANSFSAVDVYAAEIPVSDNPKRRPR